MALVRKAFDLNGPAAAAWLRARPGPQGMEMRPLAAEHDRAAVGALVTACRQPGEGMAARLQVAGLLAEVGSRDGRVVRAWMAIGEAGDVVGLVTLSEATGGVGTRFSIGWLLVHPLARRRGIGTALVRHALLAAQNIGARMVYVETQADWADATGFWQATDGGFQRPDAGCDRGPGGGYHVSGHHVHREA